MLLVNILQIFVTVEFSNCILKLSYNNNFDNFSPHKS